MAVPESETQSVRSLLHKIKDAVISHYDLLLGALEFQRGVLDRMWVLAQRFSILTSGIPSKRTYPPEACHLVEDEIGTEFHIKLSALDDSKLTSSLSDVKSSFCALGQFLNEMDSTQLASIHQTDSIQPSVTYYLELFADFVKFFSHTQSKFNCYAILLRVDQVSSVDRYKELLQPNDEFNEHFLKSLSYCSCLHSHKKEKT